MPTWSNPGTVSRVALMIASRVSSSVNGAFMTVAASVSAVAIRISWSDTGPPGCRWLTHLVGEDQRVPPLRDVGWRCQFEGDDLKDRGLDRWGLDSSGRPRPVSLSPGYSSPSGTSLGVRHA